MYEIQNTERLNVPAVSRAKLEYALNEALKKIDYALPVFTELFPSEASRGNVYEAQSNLTSGGWNTGFWSGILWHAYELTGEKKYRDTVLERQLPSFLERIEKKLGVNHHDMGFLYVPSCVAAYKLTGSELGKQAALLAAEHLFSRYHPEAGFIQAWGDLDDPNAYRLIIDCLMNLPLLYWASEVTGDSRFADAAYTHYQTTRRVILRPDGSTYHTCFFDPVTHLPEKCVTHQGASNDSAWSRGQAWGIYGPLLTYLHHKDPSAMEMFRETTAYYLNHLPADFVPYWDLCFTDGDGQPKDSSAAAIALAGMLEGIRHMEETDPMKPSVSGAISRTMDSLIDSYLTKDVPQANGLLLHASYSVPHNNGVDEMNIWGDYFYMEALHRMLDPQWNPYW